MPVAPSIAQRIGVPASFAGWGEMGGPQSSAYLRRARTADHNAPTPPTSASTAVGFSGESVQPVCARSGAATSSISPHPRNTIVDLVIYFLPEPALQKRPECCLTALSPDCSSRSPSASTAGLPQSA